MEKEVLMKKGFLIGGAIFLVLFIAALFFFSPRFSGNIILSIEDVSNISENTIQIRDFTYFPKEVKLSVGEEITWVNLDYVRHTVTSDGGGPLNSVLLSQGEEYSYIFTTPGEYDYYCTPHPYMTGRIVVE